MPRSGALSAIRLHPVYASCRATIQGFRGVFRVQRGIRKSAARDSLVRRGQCRKVLSTVTITNSRYFPLGVISRDHKIRHKQRYATNFWSESHVSALTTLDTRAIYTHDSEMFPGRHRRAENICNLKILSGRFLEAKVSRRARATRKFYSLRFATYAKRACQFP